MHFLPSFSNLFFSFPALSHSIDASRKWNRFSACESTGYLNGRRLEVDSPRTGCNNFPRRCVYINRNISGSLDGCKRCRLCHGILRERAREAPRKEKRLRFVIIADLNASRQRPPTRCFGQVRVCRVSFCHEQTIHRLVKNRKRLYRVG